MKLALNGTYGASNDQFSPLYDPKFTMAITINGQLSLCMLAEKLLTVDGLQIIQCNTDGLTYRCKRGDVALTDEICKDWEKTTRLDLETVVYSKMAIADVNNYIAVKEDGSVKTKGRFVYEGLGWHQNQSNLVIKRAAVNYLVDGIPVEKTIRECTDKFDFMARTKVPRSSKLMMVREDGVEIQLQNICRYFVAIGGGELVKVMPPLDKPEVWTILEKDGDVVEVKAKTDIDKYKRKGYEVVRTIDKPSPERRIGINAGVSVIDCSDVKNFDWSLVDYDWYIDQAKKLVAFELDDE